MNITPQNDEVDHVRVNLCHFAHQPEWHLDLLKLTSAIFSDCSGNSRHATRRLPPSSASTKQNWSVYYGTRCTSESKVRGWGNVSAALRKRVLLLTRLIDSGVLYFRKKWTESAQSHVTIVLLLLLLLDEDRFYQSLTISPRLECNYCEPNGKGHLPSRWGPLLCFSCPLCWNSLSYS